MPEIINSAKFILLDIAAHDGKQEEIFINKLKPINYKGFIICDDIHLTPQMKKWWNSVDLKKYDIIEIGHWSLVTGHWSGTGIISFNGEEFNII